MNIEIRQNSLFTFKYEKFVGNIAANILSAELRVLSPAGKELLPSTPMTIVRNTATLDIDFGNPANSPKFPLGRNFLAELYIDKIFHNRLFDIVRYTFVNEVTEVDLASENKIVTGSVNESRGEADSGTASTLTDLERIEPKNYWKGGRLAVYPLTDGEEITYHNIASFNSTTKVLSFVPDRRIPITTESYSLRRSYEEGIRLAGEVLQADLWKKNRRSSLILDSTQVSRLIVYKFFERFFGELATGKDSEYAYQHERYKALYDTEFESLPLLYDRNEDGAMDAELEISVTQTLLER